MPVADQVVRQITIKGAVLGVDETTASVNKLSEAIKGVQVASDTTSRSTGTIQAALDKQQRSLDTAYRAQVQFNASQKIITQAYNEGLVTKDRFNQLLDLARDRFDKATASTS